MKVPDIGDFKDIPIIEVLVQAWRQVEAEQSLVTLESDKATMDVPSPAAGKIGELRAKVGDKVSMGSLIAKLDAGGTGRADLFGAGGRSGREGRGGRGRSARNLAGRAQGSAARARAGFRPRQAPTSPTSSLAPRFDGWRGSSTSISTRSKAPERRAASLGTM